MPNDNTEFLRATVKPVGRWAYAVTVHRGWRFRSGTQAVEESPVEELTVVSTPRSVRRRVERILREQARAWQARKRRESETFIVEVDL